MFQHVPAVFVQGQLFAQVAAAVEHAQTFRAEHPLVAVGHHERAARGLHIEGQGAQMLDGIHAEQHAPGGASLAEAGQIQQQAAGILHRADGQQPGARPAGSQQIGLRIGAAQADLQHLDAMPRQGLPDDPVRGEFLVADHHLVTGAPVQSEGNEGQAFRSVLHQCDVIGGGCIEQATQPLAQAMFHREPVGIVAGTDGGVLLREGANRTRSPLRPGCHGRVVEVAQAFRLGELVKQIDHGGSVQFPAGQA